MREQPQHPFTRPRGCRAPPSVTQQGVEELLLLLLLLLEAPLSSRGISLSLPPPLSALPKATAAERAAQPPPPLLPSGLFFSPHHHHHSAQARRDPSIRPFFFLSFPPFLSSCSLPLSLSLSLSRLVPAKKGAGDRGSRASMDDQPGQSPLVSSTSPSSSSLPGAEQGGQPQKPLFQYQFVKEPEDEEEEEEEEDDDEEVDDERLEVRERKPVSAPPAPAAPNPFAAAPPPPPGSASAPPRVDLGASGEEQPPRPPPKTAWSGAPEVVSSSSSSSSSYSSSFSFSSSSVPFGAAAAAASATEATRAEENEAETPPPRSAPPAPPPREEPRAPAVPPRSAPPPPKRPAAAASGSPVVDLLYWRDVKKTGVVFGASLFLLLSLTVFSIVSVVAYIALALLSVTISFRIYKGVIQAVQKSDEGHPFRTYLDKDVAVSEELVQKYSNVVLGHFNSTVKELRRLFLVDDLVDSLKFAVLMWVFTYVGALFNGLTLLILALISLFSIPIIYEKYQAQIDHYVGFVNKNVKDAMTKIQAKIPGLKRKTE
uniref:Reticulon n=1 Tax=Pogona vitticeps TaxID=103695 RepID=A0ABM5FDM1_9SAUR